MNKKKLFIRLLIAFVIVFLVGATLTLGVRTKNGPLGVQSAGASTTTLTGCGTTKAVMKKSGYDLYGFRLLTVRLTREFTWCRDLHCEFFRTTPCWYGTARITSVVLSPPSLSTTALCLDCSIKTDWSQNTWRNQIQGGDWGYHSRLDSYYQFHVHQCFGIWLVNQCQNKSFSWKISIKGSGGWGGDYSWG
jgi:hypothetical protein